MKMLRKTESAGLVRRAGAAVIVDGVQVADEYWSLRSAARNFLRCARSIKAQAKLEMCAEYMIMGYQAARRRLCVATALRRRAARMRRARD